MTHQQSTKVTVTLGESQEGMEPLTRGWGEAAEEVANILPRNLLTAFSFSATRASHSSWSLGFSR